MPPWWLKILVSPVVGGVLGWLAWPKQKRDEEARRLKDQLNDKFRG